MRNSRHLLKYGNYSKKQRKLISVPKKFAASRNFPRPAVWVSDAQCLFFFKRVFAYNKRYNTCSTRVVPLPIWVLS